MARSATIGEMSTRVIPQRITVSQDANGFPVKERTNLFQRPLWCKWVWEHGAEALENLRRDLTETAVITMWYAPGIQNQDVIQRMDDGSLWDVVRVNVGEDRMKYTEIYLARRVKA